MEPHTADPRFYSFLEAVQEDKTKALELLVEDPTLLEIRGTMGEAPLHFLAIAEEYEAVEWLLQRGADIDPINDFGDTPLLEATVTDNPTLCRFLLERGANLCYQNEATNTTAFSYAATIQPPALNALKVLLEYFPAEGNIDDYFDFWSWQQVWKQGGEAAALLSEYGLSANR